MSLSKCKECGNDVSNQAKTCPHCGAGVRKSRWGVVILFVLIVGASASLAYTVPKLIELKDECLKARASVLEELDNGPEKAVVKDDVKAIVENNVREMLNEKYGVQCISIDIGQLADGSFAGTAKLEDGREIDIEDARIDGEMIRFKHSVKQGYEYKCKHHFNQLKIGEKPGLWGTKVAVLAGEIWNDGSGLIRGFVAFEFVDDNGNVCYKNREIAFIPKADQFTGISADYWIPPGKNAIFICNVPDGVLKLNNINARLEFFNLGNEPAASYVYDNPSVESMKSVLETIPVKVTSQIYKIQIEKANEDAKQ
jgi:RNA polymerase subunit RPABC4/transcription elongation factor Spt4